MSDQPLLPPPDEQSEPIPTGSKPERRNLVPWFYGVGFIVLAAAIFYLWQYPSTPVEPPGDASALQTAQQNLSDISARVAALERQPMVDSSKITADLSKITARVDALDGRVSDQTQLASRLDTLSGRIESLSGRDQTGLDSTKQQLGALSNRVAAMEANAGNLDAAAQRLNRIAKLQEASFALASGRPVGDLPNVPAALARYAHSAPPTEAQLRQRFSQDKQAALAAKQPNESDTPFVDRVWDRAQGLITIRRGDDVVVGNPTAMTLNRAQTALNAGDLSGAVSAVDALQGQPGQAMANWLADAKALLGARSALANMADHA